MVHRVPVQETVSPAKLAEPITFPTSNRIAKNRFMKAALTERVATWIPDDRKKCGFPTTDLCNMYEKLTHGGFGVLLSGNIAVDANHLESAGNVIIHHSIDSPERREAFKCYAAAFKAGSDNLAIAQLSNAGRQTPRALVEHPISASDVQLLAMRRGCGYGKPRALTIEEIHKTVVHDFAYAAKYVYDSGFDGVQIHSAHGYLLAQFVSETTNKRTDQYGGSLKNRNRLNLEIYEAIRRLIPVETGFIVGIKMNSKEFQVDGLECDDAVYMCKEYERIGFDFIELSGGTIEKVAFQHLSESTISREAFFFEFSAKIKAVLTTIIVYLTGGFRTVHGMVKAIEQGACDGIGLGRPITAEIDLPAKILSGEVQSAILNPYDQDYNISSNVSSTQMWQAQQTPYNTEKGVNVGIMDINDEETAEKYKAELVKYNAKCFELSQAGVPIKGVLEFQV
uniref:Oxidored_FMN domain-containing protein n=1 Tax=Panagrellus redivivus TaxID=6233 RepID=A0A7E4UPX5_PANRE